MESNVIEIPAFMAKPKRFITFEENELLQFIDREAQVRIDKFNLGFAYGLGLGLLVTAVAIVVFTFILFTPLNVLMA